MFKISLSLESRGSPNLRSLWNLSFIIVFLFLLANIAQSDSTDTLVAKLPSGLTVIIREEHTINLAAVDIWIKAGSINETEENRGGSHFVEHMIFKGTRKYGPGEIDRTIEGIGAELNGGTSKDYVHFYTTVASEYLPVALDVLADAIINTRFAPEDFEKERGIILDEIARSESDPSQRALSLFMETAYSVHPYRFPSTGTRESVQKLTLKDLEEYYLAHYTPENTCVVIVGDVNSEAALDLVKTKFADFRMKSSEAVQVPQEPLQTKPIVRRVHMDIDQAYIVLGVRAPSASEFKDICALDILLGVLGDSYRGRLSSIFTEKGIRFTKIDPDFTTRRDPTVFLVLVAVDPEDAEKAEEALLGEFDRLAQEGLSESEIGQGKRLVVGSDLFERETFSGEARTLGLGYVLGLPELASHYVEIVQNLGRAEVNAAIRKYLGGNKYTLVVIGPQVSAEGS